MSRLKHKINQMRQKPRRYKTVTVGREKQTAFRLLSRQFPPPLFRWQPYLRINTRTKRHFKDRTSEMSLEASNL